MNYIIINNSVSISNLESRYASLNFSRVNSTLGLIDHLRGHKMRILWEEPILGLTLTVNFALIKDLLP